MSIDLSFIPDYWTTSGPVEAINRNIKGQLRRALIADIVTGNVAARAADDSARTSLSEVPLEMLSASLPDPGLLGRSFHPAWLGGEFLPDYQPGEVEICRIVMPTSVLLDVISIRALQDHLTIYYRVVDEHETPLTSVISVSARPLSMGEMVMFIHSIRAPDDFMVRTLLDKDSYVDYLMDQNAEGNPEEWMTVDVESEFYPEIAPFFATPCRGAGNGVVASP